MNTNIKSKNKNTVRIILQWAVLGAILLLGVLSYYKEGFFVDFEAYCPFGGMQALGSYLLNNALACSMTGTQIVMGIILMVATLALSKLFCSFICPIGTISEWLGKLGSKLKIRFTITGIFDKILRSLKYILLFITLYFTLQSNELFCKQYDPFFAIASGFNLDVVVLYAIITIAIVILGSVVIRLFWCKYICPLGAISNIFKFTALALGVIAIYVLTYMFIYPLSYVYPLAIACVGGFIIEISGKKNKTLPLIKITRNTETCTNCGLCSKSCPQAIEVAEKEEVFDADCNICGDCLHSCPVKNTLQINKKNNLENLPAIATVLLIVIGMFLGELWEIPTIDKRWYEDEDAQYIKTTSIPGMQKAKCYGSAMALASQMAKIKGIGGVAVYVKTKTVKLFYDSRRFSEAQAQELIFTPSKLKLREMKNPNDKVIEYTLWLENFFDTYDFNYLAKLLQQETDALAVCSEFSCPVTVKIYFSESSQIPVDKLIERIEAKSLSFEYNGKTNTVELDFEAVKEPLIKTISSDEYKKAIFKPFRQQFNYFAKYDSTVVSHYKLPFGKNSAHYKQLKFLVSHLSNNIGVIEFSVKLDSNKTEQISIAYVDSMTTPKAIMKKLLSDTLLFTYKNGKVGKTPNLFVFETDSILNHPQEP